MPHPPPAQAAKPWLTPKKMIGLCVLGLVAGLVLPNGSSKEPHRSSPAPASPQPESAATVATPESLAPPMPEAESNFCWFVNSAAENYEKRRAGGANQIRLSEVRAARRKELRTLFGSGWNEVRVKRWVGKVTSLSTTGDERAAVAVRLPCRATFRTWNNALSDRGHDTLIPASLPVYSSFAGFKQDQWIIFSGLLFSDRQDVVAEMSVSESGSMRAPEFLFRFEAAEAAR